MRQLVWLNIALCALQLAPVAAQETQQAAAGELYEIDSIAGVIYARGGKEIITKSDIERPSLNGTIRTFDDLAFGLTVYLDAQEHKILPDEKAVDAYLASIQRQNNLTLDQLKYVFMSAGFTLEEGREELARIQAINSMVDYKVRSGLIVSRKKIEEYYQQHPEYAQEEYQLQYVHVPYNSSVDRSAQRQEIMEYVRKSPNMSMLVWSDPFHVKATDLAQDKQFISRMQEGQVSKPKETLTGFEMYWLKEKKSARLLTLQERYDDIASILQQPKFDELMEKYRQELKQTAVVVRY